MKKLHLKNDFGTPHCRVIKTAEETTKGEYRLRFVGEDIGLENTTNTFGYGIPDKKNTDDMNI